MHSHGCPTRGVAADGSRLEVSDIVRAHLDDHRQRYALHAAQQAAVRAMLACRTAALGGHLEVCTHCAAQRPAYNSCPGRHCPKCQALAAARWVEQRLERMLPTHHFHVVFTLPAELRSVAHHHRAMVLDLLLRSAAQTLSALARDPKWLGAPAQLGVTAVLHTWTRDMARRPHVHCIVTGGGLALDGSRWLGAKPDFLFPVHVLGALFRGKMLAGLEQALRTAKLTLPEHEQGRAWRHRLRALYDKSWVVYAKRPFGGRAQVYRYLGRYTHRVAISSARLLRADARSVTFRTRGDQTATVTPLEFVRRFLQHVLPHRFVKIRHYGLMASGGAALRLELPRQLLAPLAEPAPSAEPAIDELPEVEPEPSWCALYRALTGRDLTVCIHCGQRSVVRVPLPSPPQPPARAPPTSEAA
jgi:Putative transposase/Transposase zinc-binding domain